MIILFLLCDAFQVRKMASKQAKKSRAKLARGFLLHSSQWLLAAHPTFQTFSDIYWCFCPTLLGRITPKLLTSSTSTLDEVESVQNVIYASAITFLFQLLVFLQQSVKVE